MTKLTQLANLYTSDKGTEHYEKHGYTEEYAKYIPEKGKFNLLEIGIWHGDSIKMWRDYNPELVIDAVDIDENVLNYIKNADNLKIHIGDQADESFLHTVVKDKVFDFIVDDGSHRRIDIVKSFRFLYDHLKLGGYYFIEDLHAPHAERHVCIMDVMKHLHTRDYRSAELYCNDKLLIIKK